MAEIKKMSVKEFRELGYLQELNRRFLHPLGLALEIVLEKDGTESFGGVWDYRDDPEGMSYADGVIDQDKAKRISDEQAAKEPVRFSRLGYIIQPETPETKPPRDGALVRVIGGDYAGRCGYYEGLHEDALGSWHLVHLEGDSPRDVPVRVDKVELYSKKGT